MTIISNDWVFTGVVENVVDGDTYDISIDLGFKVYHKVRVRLRGVDTPEQFGPNATQEGKEVTGFVKSLILGDSVVLRTYKTKPSSFNRWDADIFFMLDDRQYNLGDYLLERDKAVLDERFERL